MTTPNTIEMPDNSHRHRRRANLIAFILGAFAIGSYGLLPLTGVLNHIERYPLALIVGSVLAFIPAIICLGIMAALSRKRDSRVSAIAISGAIGVLLSCLVLILGILNIPYRWPYSPWVDSSARVIGTP